MYVCIHICMYLCMYLCMHVHIYRLTGFLPVMQDMLDLGLLKVLDGPTYFDDSPLQKLQFPPDAPNTALNEPFVVVNNKNKGEKEKGGKNTSNNSSSKINSGGSKGGELEPVEDALAVL
jgi:hypothetical protein